MQKKRSAVWRHFDEEGDNKVACKTCHKRLTKHGNTSMMIRHLRGQHPEIMHCLLDADRPTVTGEGVSWQLEEQQVEEVVESLPPLENSVKKKRSTVWRHFEEEGNDKVSCRICNEKLAKHGNTSSMLRHLRGKHPQLKLGELQGDRKLNRLHLRASNSESRFLSVCERLLRHNQLTDCTLVADGQFVQAHRLILATCSESFEEMFKTVMHANPVIVLRDITIQELRGLINYMYKGETLVKSSDLPGLLKAAAQLKIKGLSQMGLADSWMDDSRSAVGMQSQHMTSTKTDMNFYHDDPVMDDLDDDDDDEVDQHVEHSTQGQRKKSDPALDLMAMYEEVEVDEAHSGILANSEDNSRGMKRVQIKLEHGTGIGETHVQTSVESPPVMSTHLHPHQAHQSDAPFLTAEDVDIHKESIEMREDHRGAETRATIRISHGEDPLAQAVKVTQTSEDMTEPNMSGILTHTGTMMRMGDPPHTSTSVQDTIDVQEESGVILLGLSDGEPQGRVYAGGSSHTSTPQSLRPTHPRRFRKYSKQDLITALNLVRDGHLGIKPAARAFNIPVATLYNVTKRHNVSSPMQQVTKKTTNEAVKKHSG